MQFRRGFILIHPIFRDVHRALQPFHDGLVWCPQVNLHAPTHNDRLSMIYCVLTCITNLLDFTNDHIEAET